MYLKLHSVSSTFPSENQRAGDFVSRSLSSQGRQELLWNENLYHFTADGFSEM